MGETEPAKSDDCFVRVGKERSAMTFKLMKT